MSQSTKAGRYKVSNLSSAKTNGFVRLPAKFREHKRYKIETNKGAITSRFSLSLRLQLQVVLYYDGQDLSGLDVDTVRRQLGVVLQNGQLSSASIFENIAGGAQITLDEAWKAARISGFADDITTIPMQMHTVVSEGDGNLSGGQ